MGNSHFFCRSGGTQTEPDEDVGFGLRSTQPTFKAFFILAKVLLIGNNRNKTQLKKIRIFTLS